MSKKYNNIDEISRNGFIKRLTTAWLISSLLLTAILAGCGGSKSGTAAVAGDGIPAGVVITTPNAAASDKPVSVADASRFLHKASFGPTESEMDSVSKSGPRKWVVNQLGQAASLYTEGGSDEIDKWQDKNVGFCDGFAFTAPYSKNSC